MASASRRVTLASIASTGEAVARLDGRDVLVSEGIPGETVEIVVTSDAKGAHARATVLRVIDPSRHRVRPRCRHAGECGGCTWQHVSYAEQLRLKQRLVRERLQEALGQQAPSVSPTIGLAPIGSVDGAEGATDAVAAAPAGAPTDAAGFDLTAPWGFRNKVHFVMASTARGDRGASRGAAAAHARSRLVMGHYRAGSRDVTAVEECPVHADAGNRTAFALRDSMRAAHVESASTRPGDVQGLVRHIVIRVSERSGETMAAIVATRIDDARLRQAMRRAAAGADAPISLYVNAQTHAGAFLFGPDTRRVHGRERLRDEAGGVTFLLSPTSFFQTNMRAAGTLVRLVVDALASAHGMHVLDLYAGAGLFALPLARSGCRVTAVEENPEAVADGLASLRFNRLTSAACRFVNGRVEDALDHLSPRSSPGPTSARAATGRRRPGLVGAAGRISTPVDAVVLDPPRQGCSATVIDRVFGALQPLRAVYVSCDPSSLARDLARIREIGERSRGPAYRVESVQPLDMFPHTAHVETVVSLTRLRA